MFSSFVSGYGNITFNNGLKLISLSDAISSIQLGGFPAGTKFKTIIIWLDSGWVEFYQEYERNISNYDRCVYRAKGLFSLQPEPATISFYDLTNRDG